jgi:asparagine synthase (glutamine-hydrolysing)
MIDMATYLPEAMLMKVDRASMAHGLEVRVPLLDTDVVAAGLGLADSRKVSGSRGKLALRDLALRRLPKRVAAAPKRGFGMPVGEWFRGGLADVYRDLVLTPGARTRAILADGAAQKLLARHRWPIFNLGPRLWALLMLELWARAYRIAL